MNQSLWVPLHDERTDDEMSEAAILDHETDPLDMNFVELTEYIREHLPNR